VRVKESRKILIRYDCRASKDSDLEPRHAGGDLSGSGLWP